MSVTMNRDVLAAIAAARANDAAHTIDAADLQEIAKVAIQQLRSDLAGGANGAGVSAAIETIYPTDLAAGGREGLAELQSRMQAETVRMTTVHGQLEAALGNGYWVKDALTTEVDWDALPQAAQDTFFGNRMHYADAFYEVYRSESDRTIVGYGAVDCDSHPEDDTICDAMGVTPDGIAAYYGD
jgi:hypothetical protein